MSNPNADVIEAWNTILFDKFCRFRHLLIDGLGQHSSQLFKHYPAKPGMQVLDIGCGFGDTTVQLAQMVGSGGKAVGVDCASNFIEASLQLAASQGADNTEYICCDVQFDKMGGPYDAAYSRFGAMFFNSPVVALKNIRQALKPGGILAMSVWRKRQDNPCFYVAQQTVERFINESDKATDQITCGPGPFSMAGPDMVSDQLLMAGFVEPQFRRFDAPMCIGKTVEEALEFAREVGPAGETMRLADKKASHLKGQIELALKDALQPFLSHDGVWANSSTWLVTAKVPD